MRASTATALLCVVAAASSAADGDGEDGADTCRLYLAQSTIPHAGLGMFTGVPLERDEYVGYGDPAIPIVDIDFHAGGDNKKEDFHWLHSEYTWMSKETGADMGSEAEQTSAYATGFGSLPNCHFRLKNIGEDHCQHDTVGINRGDAGAGAFTPYHNRSTYTLKSLEPGSELFVDYGINWFLSREQDMGLVPLTTSYPAANNFMKAMESLVEKLSASQDSDAEQSQSSLESAMSDLWDIIKQSPYKSRPLSAIPPSYSVAQRAFEVGIQQTELEMSIRSMDYLKSHGKCVDNIRPGKSSIPHAGRGAFATRSIPKGGYISIAPLIHIPERDVLNMYADEFDPETGESIGRDYETPTGHQLLLNYCFGHSESTLLLCPYTPGVAYINHNGESPNAKIVWSDNPLYHNASWLNEPVSYFDNMWSVGMAIEYVAIRDINAGDEIVIDYGEEWQDAWTKHVEQWKSPEGAETYISPQQLNNDPSIPIPTHDEDATLIGDNMSAWCHFSKDGVEEDRHVWKEEHDEDGFEYSVQRILYRTPSDDGSFHYTVELDVREQQDEEEPVPYVVVDVPRKTLSFYLNEYRSDIFIKGAFRHEMMIPDEIFPEAWKNVVA